MKQKLLLIIAVLFTANTFAQSKFYKDSTFTQAFSLLSGSTSVNNGQYWDDPDYTIPIGFNFHFFKDSTTNLYMNSILGPGGVLSTKPITQTTTFASMIIASASDLQDKDTSTNSSFSPLSYVLTGVAPNRIFKMQWKNAGFYNPISNGVLNDSMDLQLWLHETTDRIDIRFGTVNLVSTFLDLYDGGTGPLVAIVDSFDLTSGIPMKNYSFKNQINNPTLDSITNIFTTTPLPGMIGNPTSGMVFSFIPKKPTNGGSVGYSSIVSKVNNDILYFHQTQQVKIDIYNDIKNASYQIIDISGKIISQKSILKNKTLIDMSSFTNGMYIIQCKNNHESFNYKIVK
jgi:hypothetical protein